MKQDPPPARSEVPGHARVRNLILLLIVLVPTFVLMLRPGIYTMQDLTLFRQVEFTACAEELALPCRWSANAGMGYGQPVFNYYGQLPYWLGQVFHTLGFSLLDSVKLVFIFSLVGSAVAMYWLARRYWGTTGAWIAAILYTYAPYRAVNVWVRGAINEALAFVLFPIIFYHFDGYLEKGSKTNMVYLSVFLALLSITHNLSFFVFGMFLGGWYVFRCLQRKTLVQLKTIWLVPIITFALAAFYLMPVVLESHLVEVSKITVGYYDYRAHFATLSQLFLSRFWGYGASLWGPQDDISISLGHVQWMALGAGALIMAIKRKLSPVFITCTVLAVLAVFFTHNKSQVIWSLLPGLKFMQFPWRFIGLFLFFSSFASGYLGQAFGKYKQGVALVTICLTIVVNVEFFRPDIWRSISDSEQFSGQLWDEQRSGALQDFWPATAPQLPSTIKPDVWDGVTNVKSGAHYQMFEVQSAGVAQQIPVVYFPGWTGYSNGQVLQLSPGGDLGLITLNLPEGTHIVDLRFENTWPRTLGNALSLVAVIYTGLWLWQKSTRRYS